MHAVARLEICTMQIIFYSCSLLPYITSNIQHQDTTKVTQPNLIAICFARKPVSRQRRLFSPANYKQKLTSEMTKKTKARSEKVFRLQ